MLSQLWEGADPLTAAQRIQRAGPEGFDIFAGMVISSLCPVFTDDFPVHSDTRYIEGHLESTGYPLPTVNGFHGGRCSAVFSRRVHRRR